MRDLLPEEARQRRALGKTILDHFALHGYELVTPPAFELASVLEKGLGALDPGDVLRFVEPESGEVCALRPDMTPQIARMVATRLADEPLPLRLSYEGTVVRRRQGRAKKHRQIPQAGIELYGASADEGDLEVLGLCASVMREAGLSSFVIDLGHAQIARSLVSGLPLAIAEEVTDALVHKDTARLDALLSSKQANGVDATIARALVGLLCLSGGEPDRPGIDVLEQGEKLVRGTSAEGPLRELARLWRRAHEGRRAIAWAKERSLEGILRLDLGEVRGFAYYTGVIFHCLAPGPGEPIGAGGRYDDLLGRFGLPMSAIGFGLNLDALARARQAANVKEPRPLRVVVAEDADALGLVDFLRARTIAACRAASGEATLRYASAHHFTHAVTLDVALGIRLVCLDDPAASRVFAREAMPDEIAMALGELCAT